MSRKKVKFSLTKYTNKGSFRFFGYGEIDEDNLYTEKKTYEDFIRHCKKIVNKQNEFKGSFSQVEEIEYFNSYKDEYVTIEVENSYDLWFRVLN